MLVLSRKNGEMIRIGNDIEVTILGICNGHVRIGVQCPREIRVDRQEITDRKELRDCRDLTEV